MVKPIVTVKVQDQSLHEYSATATSVELIFIYNCTRRYLMVQPVSMYNLPLRSFIGCFWNGNSFLCFCTVSCDCSSFLKPVDIVLCFKVRNDQTGWMRKVQSRLSLFLFYVILSLSILSSLREHGPPQSVSTSSLSVDAFAVRLMQSKVANACKQE